MTFSYFALLLLFEFFKFELSAVPDSSGSMPFCPKPPLSGATVRPAQQTSLSPGPTTPANQEIN